MKKKTFTDIDFEMFIMPFGKYKNWILEDLPAHYVLWMLDRDYCPDVLKAWGELHEEELKTKLETYDLMYQY